MKFCVRKEGFRKMNNEEMDMEVVIYGESCEINSELNKLLYSFGENLYALRSMKNMELREAAELADISVNTLYRIERGEVYPRMDMLIKLLFIYDCSIDRVIDVISFDRRIKGEIFAIDLPLTIKDENEALDLARRIVEQKSKRNV